MTLLRRLLGDELRRTRQRQQRTLREVSSAARVSLGYLSEVERGQKEPSSELLAAICAALEVRLSDVLRDVSDAFDAESVVSPKPHERVEIDPVVIDHAQLRAGEPVGDAGRDATDVVPAEPRALRRMTVAA